MFLLDIAFISSSGSIESDTINGHIVYVRKIERAYFIGIVFHEEINSAHQPSLYEHLQTIARLES